VSGMQAVPPVRVVAPSPSLLTSASKIGWPYSSFGTGVEWMADVCQPTHMEERCTDYDDENQRTGPVTRDRMAQEVFTAYTPIACDWVMREHAVKMDDSLRELAEARKAAVLARALWMGEGLADPLAMSDGTTAPAITLRNAATDVSISGAAAPQDDVIAQLLLSYSHATDGLGGAVLHVPQSVIPSLLAANLIKLEGERYITAMGAVVSPGPGYPEGDSDAGATGTGPATAPGAFLGNDSDEAWFYVSGPVEYTFDDVDLMPESDAERRNFGRTNTYEVWAIYHGIVRVDPCTVFGALVAHPAPEVS
jgi:hypothetical protein